MEPTICDLLFSVRDTLADRVKPLIADREAIRLVDMTLLAVEQILARTNQPDQRLDLLATIDALVDQGENFASGLKVEADAIWPPRPDRLYSPDVIDRKIEQGWTRLAEQTAALSQARHGHPDQAEIDGFLAQVGRLDVGARQLPHTPTPERPDVGLDNIPPTFPDYLARKLDRPVRILAVRQLSGGFSNQTTHLTVADGAATSDVVVRLSRANGIHWPYVVTLEEEMPFLRMCHEAGVPGPRPLWLETDVGILGAPFVVTEFVGGQMRGTPLGADGAISQDLIANIAHVVAKVHALPWQDWYGRLPDRFVPAEHLTVHDSIALILRRMRTYLDAAWIRPSPIIHLLFDWLERNILPDDRSAVITHGDLGYHNWLFDGDRPTALLDWETVTLCGPAKDLANLRDVVIPVEQWPLFMHHYTQAGGVAATDEEMVYYAMLRQIQALICTAAAYEKMFTDVDPRNIDYLQIGLLGRAKLFGDAGDDLRILLG